VFDGVSTGTPIGFVIENTNQHSADYENMRHIYRPSHGDFTYQAKYGIRDYRGGGRTSARETASRVVAGALAKQALATVGITVRAYASSIGGVERTTPGPLTDEMIDLIKRVKADGDSIGGVVTCTVKGCPAGLGEPVFDKLSARLASAMMSINAAKGFEIGMGFDGAKHRGSEMIDNWVADADDARGMHAATNHSGGIQAGISNGEDIVMRVAFKPVATLLRDVDTVDDQGRAAVLKAKGRHDPCVVPRAIPVVEAMAAMTVLDAYLLNKTVHL
jgi:chorismate synthase